MKFSKDHVIDEIREMPKQLLKRFNNDPDAFGKYLISNEVGGKRKEIERELLMGDPKRSLKWRVLQRPLDYIVRFCLLTLLIMITA